MNSVFPPAARAHVWFRAIPLAALLACVWLLPGKAMADNVCWIDGSIPIAFGTVGGGGASTSTTLKFICQNDGPAVRSFRICLYMNPDDPSGVAPRRLINYGTQTHLIYDTYADPALTHLIGSTASGHPVYSISFTTNSIGANHGSTPIHARIPPGQTVAAGNYNGHVTTVIRSTSESGNTAPSAALCSTAPTTGSDYTPVTANFANTCYISTATDMDFGSVANLAGNRDHTSTISLRCPNNTAYQVALNYGSHSTGGTTRRMLGPSGNYLAYQLYRNSTRNDIWGNSTSNDVEGTGNNATQDLVVYGRVFAQAVGSPGNYSDTITITLTY